MNIEDAKRILQVYRPGGGDASNTEFAAALELTRRDPELARWFSEQQSFDAGISRSLREEPVPAHLKASLLSLSAQLAVLPWYRQPMRLALAAALVGLLGLSAFLFRPSTTSFAELRQELIANSWDTQQHLQLVSSDLGEIRHFLAQNHVTTNFVFPVGLEDMVLRGARVLECRGERVAQICMLSGSRHAHFFILDKPGLPDLPGAGAPEYESCSGWRTVSWSQGDKVYVLSGMKMWAFLKKFRQSGHWAWTG